MSLSPKTTTTSIILSWFLFKTLTFHNLSALLIPHPRHTHHHHYHLPTHHWDWAGLIVKTIIISKWKKRITNKYFPYREPSLSSIVRPSLCSIPISFPNTTSFFFLLHTTSHPRDSITSMHWDTDSTYNLWEAWDLFWFHFSCGKNKTK